MFKRFEQVFIKSKSSLVTEEEKSSSVDLTNNDSVMEKENSLALEKTEKELNSLLEIIRPDEMTAADFASDTIGGLFEDAKKIQVNQGDLLASERETTEQVLELLKLRIRAIVEDSRLNGRKDDKNREELDEGLIRRAKIALLQMGDHSDLKIYTSRRDEELELDTFSQYLYPRANESERKLSEHELDSLVKVGLGRKLINGYLGTFKLAVEKFPESALKQANERSNSSEYYNVKHVLEEAYSDKPYSADCFKYLMANKYGDLVSEYYTRFTGVDYQDAVIGRSPSYPYMADDLIEELRNKNLSPDEQNIRIDQIIKHQEVIEDNWKMPEISERYGKTIEKVKSIHDGSYSDREKGYLKISLEEGLPLAKEIIEAGEISFLHTGGWRYIQSLAENDYDWLLTQVKKYDQEHLLMHNKNLLKKEDQLDYAKKLISSGKEHLLAAMVGQDIDRRSEMFSGHSFNQVVYDELSKIVDPKKLPINLFAGLSENNFSEYCASKEIDAISILSFDLEKTEKYADYKNFQEAVRFTNSLFGENTALALSKIFGLNPESLSGAKLEEAKNIIAEKFAIMENNLPTLYPNQDKKTQTNQFLKNYSALLEETPEEMSGLLSEVKYLGRELITDDKLYLSGLKTAHSLPEEFKETFSTDVKNINSVMSNADIYKRYFSLQGAEATAVNINSCFNNIPEYLKKYETLSPEQKKLWSTLLPWTPSLLKLENIQKPAARAEYDPWRKQLLPLLRNLSNEIRFDNPEDGEIIFDYCSRLGMKNMPLIYSLFSKIAKSKNVDLLPDEVKVELEKTFNIKADELCKKDKKNIKLILSETQKAVPKMISDFRKENPKFVSSTLESPYAIEFLKTIIGDSGYGHGASTEEVLKTYQEALQKNPEKFILKPGYEETEISVPEVVVSEGEKQEKIASAQNKILANPELGQTITTYKTIVDNPENSLSMSAWLRNKGSEVNIFLTEVIDELKEKILKEEKKVNGNAKAKINLNDRLHKYQTEQQIFNERFSALSSDGAKIKETMEGLFRGVPEDWPGKKNLLMELSWRDMASKVPEGQRAVSANINSDSASQISAWHEFISNHVSEHYLNKKHGRGEAIETEDKDLIKILKKYWGTQDFDKSILAVSHEKIKKLERGELSEKLKAISLVPSKGLQRIFSGDIGKACTSNQNSLLAQGAFENITSYSLVVEKNTLNERFVGSFLIIETRTETGEPALVLRANDPEQNVFNMVDGKSLIASIVKKVQELAKRRQINNVLVPLQSGASSNRPEVLDYYRTKFSNNEKVSLVNNPETNFNNYNIWNKEGTNAVIKI